MLPIDLYKLELVINKR